MSPTAQTIVEELGAALSFQQSVTGSLSRTVTYLSEHAILDMANFTLLRRDSYLHQLRYGVKPDTVLVLRTAPVHLDTLFPESLAVRAEKEVADYDGRRQTKDRAGHPYKEPGSSQARYKRPCGSQVSWKSACFNKAECCSSETQ